MLEGMANIENFKFRLPAELKKWWIGFCVRKRITQTEAIIAILDFIRSQDGLTQSMILGQIEPAPDLVEAVLRRLDRRGKSGGTS